MCRMSFALGLSDASLCVAVGCACSTGIVPKRVLLSASQLKGRRVHVSRRGC